MQENEESKLDDLLASFGLGVAPVTREDEVYSMFTEGSAPKVDNCRYWLSHQLALFHYITKEENKKITTDSFVDGKPTAKQLNNTDYAKLMLKYYLQSHHLPYFIDLDTSKPKADIVKVIDMLLRHEGIKAIVDRKW